MTLTSRFAVRVCARGNPSIRSFRPLVGTARFSTTTTKPPRPTKSTPPKKQTRLSTDTILHGPQGLPRYDTLSSKSFAQSAIDTLTRPVQLDELEIDPDRGFIYVRENVYEEILDTAFGSDGWTLHPLTPFHTLNDKIVYRTYALFVHSRFVSEAIGDWSLKTCQGDREVAEAKCRHTALVRVCKDIGVASELWDPRVVNTMRDKVFESVWDDDGEGARRKVWREKINQS